MAQEQVEIDTGLMWIVRQIANGNQFEIKILYTNCILRIVPSHVTILGNELRFTVIFHMHNMTKRELCVANHYKESSEYEELPGRAVTILNSKCISAHPTTEDNHFHIRINPDTPYRF